MAVTADDRRAEVAAELVARIGRGERDAEAELVERYSRGVLVVLRHVTGDPDLADDLHQETFRVALEKLRAGGIDKPESLSAFLRATARNLATAVFRKRARQKTDADPEQIERVEDTRPSQQAAVERREDAELVRDVLGELRVERDRQLLFRYYIAEDDKQRICAELELSGRQFDRVLFRARQRFRQLLEERCPPASAATATRHATPDKRGA